MHLLVLELEVFEDVAHIGREVLDVADEVPSNVVPVALQPVEVEPRMIVEALARRRVEPGNQRLAVEAALQAFEIC